ncbi:response regulator [Belliella kenyensis]|uniref:Response regulator n=1 Tax=Belliella kenyensis TaxID=1472724 RepID=A0ABV8EMZ0_9BACT|nr:response regulator [Belliella kenyensis]MCH7403405.1 response regulator [Belliella kenyensis]MDN3601617.1 response regulator [Belliella kenyensis]
MNNKVLIVEDDVVFCKILTKFLTKNNYEVLDAQNGKDAIELMEMNKFAFAILDYRLPDMNGIEILEKLKTKNEEAKTILITRYGDQDVASKAIDKGADAFISKPINPDELLSVIKGL